MRNSLVGAVVVSAVLVGGAALAQTAGPSIGPSIVPVTGPSTAPSLPEPPKLDALVTPVQAQAAKVDAAVAMPAATATEPAPRAVKAVHKPGTKTTVKKASAHKRVAKVAAQPTKAKHVATAKRQAPTHHAAVSRAIPLAKRPPPAKDPTTSKPVLPRV